MAEDLKAKIFKFLSSNSNQKYSVKQISDNLEISYSTVLKWVEVLIASGSIQVEDWGNLKLVWYKK